MNEPEYQPTEADILAMLHKLRVTAPELATPENAIKLLEYDKIYYETLAKLDPNEIERVLKGLEEE